MIFHRLAVPACLSILLGTCANAYAQTKDPLPPVSNFYPKCEGSFVKMEKAHLITNTPYEKETKLELITQLREKAAEVNADLVILADRDVRSYSLGKFNKQKYYLIFRAEFHRQCAQNEEQYAVNKVAAYNQFGEKNITLKRAKSRSISVKLSTPGQETFNHPELTNTEISFKNGIYGIKLGSEVKDVIQTLGEPSVQLDVMEGEQVLLFGRRQAFHFQNNKLVKFNAHYDQLSQSINNKIPIRPTLDGQHWQLNNEIRRQMSLTEVASYLGQEVALDENNNFNLKYGQQVMQMQFSFVTDQETYEKQFYLYNLTLTHADYIQKPMREISDSKQLYQDINTVYLTLTNNDLVQKQTINETLKQPILMIWDSPNTVLKAFNNHLIVRQKYERLIEISFVEQILKMLELQQTSVPWYLGNFTQGVKKSELKSLFTEDVTAQDEEIIMESEWHQISLLFDNNKLNHANLVFY